MPSLGNAEPFYGELLYYGRSKLGCHWKAWYLVDRGAMIEA
jgi:hypothetical protein